MINWAKLCKLCNKKLTRQIITYETNSRCSFLSVLFSCGKDKTETVVALPRQYELNNQPEALPAYDQANYGIYKGVVINAGDSTATFKFNLYNGSSEPYALFYAHGMLQDSLVRYVKNNFGLMAFPQVKDNETITLNASFYATYFSSYRIGFGPIAGFNTNADGTSYLMETQLYNNQTLNALLKEKSSGQVHCFEGSYSGLDSGRIAFAVAPDSIIGIRASIWNPQFFKLMTAKVSNNNFTIMHYDDIGGNEFIFTGRIENNQCSGTWIKSSNPGVVNNFAARRTL